MGSQEAVGAARGIGGSCVGIGWSCPGAPDVPDRDEVARAADMSDSPSTSTPPSEFNERPRQTLGFKTPSQALAEVLR